MKKYCFFALLVLLLFSLKTITSADSYYNIPKGKTLFANVLPGSLLESENAQIAQVCAGLINAQSVGSTKVLIKRNGQHVDTINIHVSKSEGIKCCYAAPNIISSGGVATLRAITDSSVEAVKFFINESGTIKEIPAGSKSSDSKNYIFEGKISLSKPGIHAVWAKFLRDGVWSIGESSKTDAFVSASQQSICSDHRASDSCIKYIAAKEGFHGSFKMDGLSQKSYDIGYGETVNKGQVFYNNITKNEAYAKLVNVLNKGDFCCAVNNLLTKNHVKCTQNQFDALVSFTYNLGPGWTYNSALRNIILNAGVSKCEYIGRVNSSNGLNLRAEPNVKAKRYLAMKDKEEVDIKDNQRYNGNWVKVRTKDGVEGYCSADFLSIKPVISGEKDLSLVNKNLFINEFLQYHHAMKKCCKGLLYRRIEELQIFFNNDFSLNGAMNKYKFPIPKCILPFLRG